MGKSAVQEAMLDPDVLESSTSECLLYGQSMLTSFDASEGALQCLAFAVQPSQSFEICHRIPFC